jgi:hypothetical protein
LAIAGSSSSVISGVLSLAQSPTWDKLKAKTSSWKLKQIQSFDSQIHIMNGIAGGEDGGADDCLRL